MTLEAPSSADTRELTRGVGPRSLKELHVGVGHANADALQLIAHFLASVVTRGKVDDVNAIKEGEGMSQVLALVRGSLRSESACITLNRCEGVYGDTQRHIVSCVEIVGHANRLQTA